MTEINLVDNMGMQAVILQAQTWVNRCAGSSPGSDTGKWELGDLIGAMQDLVQQSQETVLNSRATATADAKAVFRQYTTEYNQFVNGQPVTRSTLVDYALIARVFPAGHPMRGCGLPFSYARTISRVAPEEHAFWIERALQEGLSVERLQRAINAAHSQATHSQTETAPCPALTMGKPTLRKKSQHTQICAATGNAISDLARMVEVRLFLSSAEEAATGRTARGAAARRGRNNQTVSFPRRFCFESLAALQTWLAAGKGASLLKEP